MNVQINKNNTNRNLCAVPSKYDSIHSLEFVPMTTDLMSKVVVVVIFPTDSVPVAADSMLWLMEVSTFFLSCDDFSTKLAHVVDSLSIL